MELTRRGAMISRRGQSTVELAVLFAVITGAVLAMQIYVKRGAMGRMREATDQTGEQFSPLNTVSEYTTSRNSVRSEKTDGTGLATTTLEQESQERSGSEQVKSKLDEETLFE